MGADPLCFVRDDAVGGFRDFSFDHAQVDEAVLYAAQGVLDDGGLDLPDFTGFEDQRWAACLAGGASERAFRGF